MLTDQNFYKELLDNLYDGVYFVDTERKITYWNKGAERLTGYRAEQVVGHYCADNLLNHCDSQGKELCLSGCPLTATFKDGNPQEAEVYLHHASGHRVPVLVRVTPIHDETGRIIGAVEIFSNNLKNLRARRKIRALKHKVLTDSLTGLGNRMELEMHFKTAMFQLENGQSQPCLAFLDVDQFKQINDTYGHVTGDLVLKMVAGTLRANLRDTDILIRWGGDEFIVLLNDITPEDAPGLADKLRALIERSHISSGNSQVGVTISIGLSMLRLEDSLDAAIHRADMNMFNSKELGRNQVNSSL